MERNAKEVGNRIKLHRQNLGETMEEFGKRFNAKSGVVSNWENAKQIPNPRRLLLISKEMNITVNELLYGSEINEFRSKDKKAQIK